ncbi:hypothetical protein D3C84_773980 [compost metagenome]
MQGIEGERCPVHVERLVAQAQQRTGFDPAGAVGHAHGAVAQPPGIGADEVGPQSGDKAHRVGGDARLQRNQGGGVVAPALGQRIDRGNVQQHELPASPLGDQLLAQGVGVLDLFGVPALTQYHRPFIAPALLGLAHRVHPVAVGGQHVARRRPVLAGVLHGGHQVGLELAVSRAQQLIEVGLGVEGEQLAGVQGGATDKQQVALNLGERPLQLVFVVDLDIWPHGVTSLGLVCRGPSRN